MHLTITQYLQKNKVNRRHLQRIIHAGLTDRLRNTYGIISVQKIGQTQLLTVREDFKFPSKCNSR